MLWLFDLDNTLHNASAEIFPQISINMNQWIADNCGTDGARLTDAQADTLRQQYWRQFGATLLGISRTPGKRAESFLKAAHQFKDLPSMVHAEKGLRALINRLPGRKVLLTNSAGSYAKRILRILGLQNTFSRIISIENMHIARAFTPKPSKRYFRYLPAHLKTTSAQCILVEDDVHSLKTAKITGMKTVLVTQYLKRSHQSTHAYAHPRSKTIAGRPAYIDHRISSVRQLRRLCHNKL